MKRNFSLAMVGIAAVAATFALAQPAKDKAAQPAGQPEMQLPPGWTPADMKVMEEYATPGKHHEHLLASAGTWTGKANQWMAPDTQPMQSDITSVVSSIMDGKFTKCDVTGTGMMGVFNGCGVYGYDNAGKEFQCSWIDNMGTGMMQGTGDLSSDGKTMTWTYHYNCPIAKKNVTMREVEKFTGKDTMTMEMFAMDPKTGKEFKMMSVDLTRTGGAPAVKPSR